MSKRDLENYSAEIANALVAMRDRGGLGGQQILLRFENNYGASIVPEVEIVPENDKDAIPYYSAVWRVIPGVNEVALIHWNGDDFSLDYEHPEITGKDDCVVRYLNYDQTQELLQRIRALPHRIENLE